MDILRDAKTGTTDVIHICNQCDPDTYPTGKPIINDINAKKDSKGNWICSECQEEDINKMMLCNLGPQHPKCQYFINREEREVRKHNDAARRLNEHSKQFVMKYKRNRYTGSMPLSPNK